MILFAGDPHSRFDHLIEATLDLKPEAVLILGDLQVREPLHLALAPIADLTWFIHGNHDTDSEADWRHLWGSDLSHRNIHGRVIQLASGVRVAGLGGVFRESVWSPKDGARSQNKPLFSSFQEHAKARWVTDRWQGGPPRKHWSSIYPADCLALSQQRSDILITHEAPGYHPHGFDQLDDLARQMHSSLVVHGHHHDCIDSSAHWSTQRFKSFGVGLRGISALEVHPSQARALRTILPGEADDRRNKARQVPVEAHLP